MENLFNKRIGLIVAILAFVGIPLCLGMSSSKKRTTTPRASTPKTPKPARVTTPKPARVTTPTKTTTPLTRKAPAPTPLTRKASAPRGTSLGKEQTAARRGDAMQPTPTKLSRADRKAATRTPTPPVSSATTPAETPTKLSRAEQRRRAKAEAPATPARTGRRAATRVEAAAEPEEATAAAKAEAPATPARTGRRAATRVEAAAEPDEAAAAEAPAAPKRGFGGFLSGFGGLAKGALASDLGKGLSQMAVGKATAVIQEKSGGKIPDALTQAAGAALVEQASGGVAEGEPSALDTLKQTAVQTGVERATGEIAKRSGGQIPDELTQAAGAVLVEKASGEEPEAGESALDVLKQTAIQKGVGKVTEEVGARTGGLPPEVQALTGDAQAAALEKAEEQLTGKEEGEEEQEEVTPEKPAQKEEVTPAAPKEEADGEEGEEETDTPAPQAEGDEAEV